MDLSEGGRTVTCRVVLPEFSVAVIVTGVEIVTWPACIWNCIKAVLPCMFTVAGSESALGSELVRLMTEPLAGAAPESCICNNEVLPLKRGLLVETMETGEGGAAFTVNVPEADQLVVAAALGDESP